MVACTSCATLPRSGGAGPAGGVGDVEGAGATVTFGAVPDVGAFKGVPHADMGDFLGQTALTREQVKADARALDELTVAWIDRQSMESLVLRRPLLMQEIGRVIEERRASMRRVTAAD